MWVNWDADGVDQANVNGESVRLQNLDRTRDLSLGGWWFRDSHLRRYTFPAWASIPAGGTITLHLGHGPAAPGRFFWGLGSPPFENVEDRRAMGDGGYLFDPQGDLRASMVYPCRSGCTDPLQGAIDIDTRPTGSEQVRLRNVGGFAVDLEGYRLETWPYGYAATR